MNKRLRQAYIRGMIDLAGFLFTTGFTAWYFTVFIEKLFS